MKLPKLIGVVQLPSLPGAPGTKDLRPVEALQIAGYQAVQDAQALAQAGFDAVLIENSGDFPYYSSQVPPETISSLAIVAAAVRESIEIPVGLSVLRNDAFSALAIASVTGCDFIRVQVLAGVVASDQGFLIGDSAQLIRERERLRASVQILADVHVAHGVTISCLDIGQSIEEMVCRSFADGVIVSGRTEDRLPDQAALEWASQVAQKNQVPLYLGSGVTRDTLMEVKPWITGAIVGSGMRKKMQRGAELDPKRVAEFGQVFKKGKVQRK